VDVNVEALDENVEVLANVPDVLHETQVEDEVEVDVDVDALDEDVTELVGMEA